MAGVVVTHDAQLASWADRVVFLRDGRVVDQTAAAAARVVARAGVRMMRDDRAAERRRCRARRAVARWAWRLFRREWRQQVLVLVLLTVAVAAAVFGGLRRHNVAHRARRRVRSADRRIVLRVADPDDPSQADLAALEARSALSM